MSTLEAVDDFASCVLEVAGRLPSRALRLVRLSFVLKLFVVGQSSRRVLDGAIRLLGRALSTFLVHVEFLRWVLAVCGKTGKFELLPFRYGALCWWFSRLARHKRLFLVSLRSSPMRQPISGCGSGCRR